jgi:hypothetical protein
LYDVIDNACLFYEATVTAVSFSLEIGDRQGSIDDKKKSGTSAVWFGAA